MALVSAGLASRIWSKPSSPQKVEVVRVDLRNYGWRKHTYFHKGEIENVEQPLAIDSKDRVLTGVTVRVGGGLPKLGSTSLSFHILRFSAHGKLDLTLPLPANSWYGNLVYLDAADDIIAKANDKVQVLPAKDEAQAQLANWKTLATCAGRWCSIEESLSRQTLLVFYALGAPPNTVQVLRGSPPHLEMTCHGGPLGALAITDAYAYSYIGGDTNPNHVPWGLATYYRWPFCDYSHVTKLGVPRYALGIWPLSDQSLFAWVPHHIGAVYSPDGQLKHAAPMLAEKHEGRGYPVKLSQDGARLATVGETWRGGSRFLDISPHMTAERVIVYDMATGKVLASIRVQHYGFCEIAISPDGHVVAAIEGPQLTIARVP